MKKPNPALDLSFQFALDIIEYAEVLEEHRKFVLSKQILRSGTSIGANIREAQSCESRSDFIHKFKVAAKEAEETEYCYCFASTQRIIQKMKVCCSK